MYHIFLIFQKNLDQLENREDTRGIKRIRNKLQFLTGLYYFLGPWTSFIRWQAKFPKIHNAFLEYYSFLTSNTLGFGYLLTQFFVILFRTWHIARNQNSIKKSILQAISLLRTSSFNNNNNPPYQDSHTLVGLKYSK